MRSICLKSLLLFFVCLVLRSETHAQPISASAESLESLVINADLVFVAKLVAFDRQEKTGGDNFNEGSFEIEQTLKGDLFREEPYRTLRVRIPDYPTEDLTEWQDHSVRLLVTVQEDSLYGNRIVALTKESLEVMSSDFKILRDPEAVIQFAKKTLSQFPIAIKRIHTFMVPVPHEVASGTQWEGFYKFELRVPVDERLEKWALAGIQSEDIFTCINCALALRYFKSDENIALMKQLLDDPRWINRRSADQDSGRGVRIYSQRKAAFETLTFWGEKVEKPSILEEIRK